MSDTDRTETDPADAVRVDPAAGHDSVRDVGPAHSDVVIDSPDESLAAAASTVPTGNDLRSYLATYLRRIRGGDMGSLPAVGALVVLVVVFSFAEQGFFSLGNFANLITQAAPSVLLAMGLVFVLLLGEIDLSAGTTSGVGAATTAVLLHNGWPWPFAVLVALLVGAIIGFFIGIMRAKVRVPSFVVTLALFLGLQGVVILIVNSAHTQGNLVLESKTLNALENSSMPPWLGWLMAAVVIAGYTAQKVLGSRSRRRRGLATEPVSVLLAKIVALLVLAVVAVSLLNTDRALNKGTTVTTTPEGKIIRVPHTRLEGVPWVVPLILVLVVGLAFVLSRTRYGRHVYAVGGNDEASRRAGIRVDGIRISVFVVGSVLAMVSGIVLASQIGVNNGEGGGNTLLLAVGAAVIGGTSLFGGKGKITDAVVGGLVVAVIINGMSDLLQGGNNAAYQAIVTGAVLTLAATVDALSRRRAGAAGLG
jgi:D-xylose transport system permease protein